LEIQKSLTKVLFPSGLRGKGGLGRGRKRNNSAWIGTKGVKSEEKKGPVKEEGKPCERDHKGGTKETEVQGHCKKGNKLSSDDLKTIHTKEKQPNIQKRERNSI